MVRGQRGSNLMVVKMTDKVCRIFVLSHIPEAVEIAISALSFGQIAWAVSSGLCALCHRSECIVVTQRILEVHNQAGECQNMLPHLSQVPLSIPDHARQAWSAVS